MRYYPRGRGVKPAGMAYPRAGRRPWSINVIVAVAVLLHGAAVLEAVECPVGDGASGMATGERGLELIKAGEVETAASCFWRAADRAGSEDEAAGKSLSRKTRAPAC